MSSHQTADSQSLRRTTVPESLTNQPISRQFGVTAGGSRCLRVDTYVGKVVAATGNTAKCQHSSGNGVWTDGKTVAITASTEKSFTTDFETEPTYLEATSHGLTDGQPFTVSGDTDSDILPAGLLPNTVYYARVVDTDNVEALVVPNGSPVILTDDGDTDFSLRAVRKFSVTYQWMVAGDQTHTPLPPSARVVLTTGSGDEVEIVDVIVSQEK
jgi:hypothetical protein